MSRLAVGSIEGLASEGYKISVASGSTFAQTGSVLQVVSTSKTDTFSSSSTSFTDVTGMSVTITPKFNTSKILVSATLDAGSSADIYVMFRFVRDSTAVFVGDTASSRPRASFTAHSTSSFNKIPAAAQFLDSPSTTSAVTYKLQMMVNGSTGYLNRTGSDRDTTLYDPRGASSITVMEIAG